ncbi:TM2 domain-containing protein [Sphingomonas mollis]|uniref:TM2 domain-containing protein n=1 Tax=Sphingomonas mollis TaxID=2795726 RepID=A0ABS0XKM9_9SPHN|nr:TM2 domain-containing protein [Sphingomonas sp. BT553]MBJ6120595.1 TM2 domain-containing protein [Sphingomonas sp. BT553]
MRGQILGVDTRTGDGLVTGDDGRRYIFSPADWAHRGEPTIGAYVDFETSENRALSICPMPVAAPLTTSAPVDAVPFNDRNKYVAAALAFLLGTLGIHRFYLGQTGSAIAMIVLSCTVIGLLVTGPLALIDTIRYLMMSDVEFANRYPRKNV